MQAQEYSVSVLGDLFVEVSSEAQGVTFETMRRDTLCYSPIFVTPGGAAMNFALAATGRFSGVNILGRVGNDAFSQVVLGAALSGGVRPFIEKSDTLPTGTAIYVRDSSTTVHRGVRLLVVDRGANRSVDTDYIERHAATISNSSLFFVDGYSFLEQPRRAAAEAAMRIARAGGAQVALDLVPHDAHLFFKFSDVACWVKSADLLIAEVRTVRRIMGLASDDEVHDPAIAHETLEAARRSFPGTAFHLRFGVGNIGNSLIGEVGHEPVLRTTGYSGTKEPRGFGDRLSAVDLADYLVRRSGGSAGIPASDSQVEVV